MTTKIKSSNLSSPITSASFGTGSFSGDLTIADKIVHSGDTNTAIRFPSADTITIETSGSERLRINSAGNITTSGDITASGSVNGAGVYSTVYTNSGVNGIYTYSETTQLSTGTQDAVGVKADSVLYNGAFNNTNSLGGLLGVNASAYAQGNAGTTIAKAFGVKSDISTTTVKILDATSFQSTLDGVFGTYYGFKQEAPVAGSTTDNKYAFYSNFATAANTFNFYANGTAPNYFAGEVGIGVTAPTAKLQVASTTTTSVLKISNSTTGSTVNDGLDLIMSGTDAYVWNRENAPLLFGTNNTERARIDSSGNVGIGTSDPTTLGSGSKFVVNQGADGNIVFARGGSIRQVQLGTSSTMGYINVDNASGGLGFNVNGSERARIDASGNLLIGTTNSAPTVNNVAGFSFIPGAGSLQVNAEANLHRMGRRQDGTIIGLYSAGVLQGTINIAGTTTSYNGGHLSRWAQLPDNSRPELLKGTVMSNLDQMSNWTNETNEQLNCVQVSTIEGDPDVAGVFVAWDSQDDGYNDILLAMTGDMVIRIGAGTVVKRGDLLMSAGDGTAKPQEDDIVRGKTVAKVTSTHVSHVYEDGSYCVPCVIMAC